MAEEIIVNPKVFGEKGKSIAELKEKLVGKDRKRLKKNTKF